ncbi:MAG: hypothetical protein KC414_11605, partial [Romboutsia sp.]|nr:hypothetical protein [Romboutsia sp.]
MKLSEIHCEILDISVYEITNVFYILLSGCINTYYFEKWFQKYIRNVRILTIISKAEDVFQDKIEYTVSECRNVFNWMTYSFDFINMNNVLFKIPMLEDFFEAAERGDLIVCKCLHYTFNLTKEDIINRMNIIFTSMTEKGRLDVLKWFHTTYGIARRDIFARVIFENHAVRYGHLDICKWLYTTFKITKKEATISRNCAFIRAAT